MLSFSFIGFEGFIEDTKRLSTSNGKIENWD